MLPAVVEGQVLRRLGAQESLWHALYSLGGGASQLLYTLRLESSRGPLQADTVRAALHRLQRQVPILRTRVEQRDDAAYLVAGACPSVQLHLLPPGGHWLNHHHQLLNQSPPPLDPAGGPLWTAHLLPGPAHTATLYLSLCHTITDGISNSMLCGQLLSNLEDELTAGQQERQDEPAPVRPPAEQLLSSQIPSVVSAAARLSYAALRERLFSGASDCTSRLLRTYVRPYSPERQYSVRMVPAAMDGGPLRTRCRSRGVSMNAALSAAVCLAAARLCTEQTDQYPLRVSTMWLANARRYLPAELRQQLYLSSVAGLMHAVRVPGPGTDCFWPLAQSIQAALSHKLQRADPLAMLALMSALMSPQKVAKSLANSQSGSSSSFAFNINNTGSLDTWIRQGQAVRIVELHRTFRADPKMESSICSHCFHSLGNTLCYDLNYVEGRVSSDDAEHFSRSVLQILAQVSGPDT